MKLRISSGSIRLRLTRSDVESLARTGSIEDLIRFGDNADGTLRYGISASPEETISVGFHNGLVHVNLPQQMVDEWAAGDEVGIEGSQMLADGSAIKINIEKDFVCLTRPMEDQADNYPHPKGEAAC